MGVVGIAFPERLGLFPLEEPHGRLYTPPSSDDSLVTWTQEAVAQILLQSNSVRVDLSHGLNNNELVNQ